MKRIVKSVLTLLVPIFIDYFVKKVSEKIKNKGDKSTALPNS